VPSWVAEEKLWIIPPSIDPYSVKNRPLQSDETLAVLKRAGLVDAPPDGDELTFFRRDGSPGLLRAHAGLVVDGGPPPVDARLVVQVSRWDRLKDMRGVMSGFADNIGRLPDDAHLMLVGPEVAGVSDDPEGAEVLEECRERWRDLPEEVRRRVHLVALPMDDVDENAHIVNAVQQWATVVVQKSLVEGFGLTVTEAMWKGRAVVASAVGGIVDQLGPDTGVLLADPSDLDAAGHEMRKLLEDPQRRAALGAAAQAHVRDRYVGDLHLLRYAKLLEILLRD
jgi:trehalose synthase